MALYEPQDGKCYTSAWFDDAYYRDELRTRINWYNQQTGKKVTFGAALIPLSYSPSQLDELKPLVAERLIHGIFFTLSPMYGWDESTQGRVIDEINTGAWDSQITNIVIKCRDLNVPVLLRFAGEMNYEPYGYNDPEAFKLAWKRIVDIFRANNVSNVAFCFVPTIFGSAGRDHRNYYPGDGYVDWVGVSYYGASWGVWPEPDVALSYIDQGIPSVYDAYPNKPFMLPEWGVNLSNDMSDAQSATWLNKFFDAIEKRPRIKFLNHWHGSTWKITSYPQTLAVYKNRVANPRYLESLQEEPVPPSPMSPLLLIAAAILSSILLFRRR